ncbi:MAG: hypothetical protein M1823_001320 [Watsoniomyces obsoletus]|nr:MAG: hypothetical protein M1823_001320 [Watsoniomyces obsoletus]
MPRTVTPHPDATTAESQQNHELAAALIPRAASGSEGGGSSSGSTSTSDASAASASSTPGPLSYRPSRDTLAIAFGVMIPVLIVAGMLIYLHRRHVRKLRSEDANDKHKSLDFGIDAGSRGKTGKKMGGPEMTRADMHAVTGHERGLSLDMGSPYVLPPALHGSRESLHSLSRTIHQSDDPYRPITSMMNSDAGSLRAYSSSGRGRDRDDASSVAASSIGQRGDVANQSLIRNAARMSRTTPPPPTLELPEQFGGLDFSPHQSQPARKDSLPAPPAVYLSTPSSGALEQRDSYIDRDMRRSNNYLGALINTADDDSKGASRTPEQQAHGASAPRTSDPPQVTRKEVTTGTRGSGEPATVRGAEPPRSMIASIVNSTASRESVEERGRMQRESDLNQFPLPPRRSSRPTDDSLCAGQPASDRLSVAPAGFDVRRLSMGFRPLPPEDPTDNPEQRANRIRSFYKEYFDESKAAAQARNPAAYYEDYDQGYLTGGNFHDAETGEFVYARPAPYAEPVARRAMTPPPRAPPRFQGQGQSRHAQSPSVQSFRSGAPPGPRAYSSASGAYGPAAPRGRPPGRRPAPPPSPLRLLPTPHLLKEDSFALPIDFAPPSTYQERRAGRPESPMGGYRPYSPAVPAHLPLASSFDDLSVMPSPHLLRKSGTFTALDFAPPPRFKSSDAGSDAGSIRSGRSNGSAMSSAHLHSIRAGAYRVSRLPNQMVGTRDDITASLRPKWDLKTDVL